MHRARIPVVEYEPLAAQFNPVRFDAREWVSLAKAAGQRYFVITAKHHDGFCMYRTALTRYNIVDATPFGRDPMAELAAECARQGIPFGFYYSQTQDWHHPGGDGNDWDYDEIEEGLCRLHRGLRQATGARAADELWPHRAHLVRHAEGHHR